MAKEWIKSVVSLDDSLNGGFMLIGDWVPFKYMDKIILNDIENGVYFIFNITQNNVIIHTCKDGKCLQHSSDSFTKFEYDSGNWILKYIDTINDGIACLEHGSVSKVITSLSPSIPNSIVENGILKPTIAEKYRLLSDYFTISANCEKIDLVKINIIEEETIYVG